MRSCVLTANITEEVLETCGAADCGLVVTSNSTTTRPAQRLVWTLVGCYIGNTTIDFAITPKSVGNQLLALSSTRILLQLPNIGVVSLVLLVRFTIAFCGNFGGIC